MIARGHCGAESVVRAAETLRHLHAQEAFRRNLRSAPARNGTNHKSQGSSQSGSAPICQVIDIAMWIYLLFRSRFAEKPPNFSAFGTGIRRFESCRPSQHFDISSNRTWLLR